MGPAALQRAWRLLEPRALRVRRFRCPACGPSLLLRLAAEETAIRCLRCRASAVALSLLAALVRRQLTGAHVHAFETSIRGDRGVLVFRDYGADLPARLLEAGFSRVHVDLSTRRRWFGFGRPVVMAVR